jgi:hypothetical protein
MATEYLTRAAQLDGGKTPDSITAENSRDLWLLAE